MAKPVPRLSIAICGGGIAGLATAVAVSRFSAGEDVQIDIYESAQALAEIGAGITLWRRPFGVLKALGLEDEFSKICQSPHRTDEPRLAFQYRKSDQTNGLHFYDMVPPGGPLAFHRAEFLDCLAKNIDQRFTRIHFGKRLSAYKMHSKQASPITLEFKDGSVASCDVLIGADGVHSATRHAMLEYAALEAELGGLQEEKDKASLLRSKKEPIWSGHTAYRTIASTDKLRILNPNHRTLTTFQLYCGKGKHIAAYPIAQGRFVNIAAYHSFPEKVGTRYTGKMVEEHTMEDLVGGYEGWEEEVIQLLQCVEKPSRWMLTVLDGLPIYSHRNTALIGDAAHAMTPHQGSGAGQALEDAYVLGSLLGHPSVTLDILPVVLEIYEQVRLPFANDVQRRSAESAWRQSFQDPICLKFDAPGEVRSRECTGGDIGRLWEVGHASADSIKWCWTTDVEDDRVRAMEKLEEFLNKGEFERKA